MSSHTSGSALVIAIFAASAAITVFLQLQSHVSAGILSNSTPPVAKACQYYNSSGCFSPPYVVQVGNRYSNGDFLCQYQAGTAHFVNGVACTCNATGDCPPNSPITNPVPPTSGTPPVTNPISSTTSSASAAPGACGYVAITPVFPIIGAIGVCNYGTCPVGQTCQSYVDAADQKQCNCRIASAPSASSVSSQGSTSTPSTTCAWQNMGQPNQLCPANGTCPAGQTCRSLVSNGSNYCFCQPSSAPTTVTCAWGRDAKNNVICPANGVCAAGSYCETYTSSGGPACGCIQQYAH